MFSGSQETVQEYVQLFQKGEEKGFNFFYNEYYDTLCYFSFKIIKDKLEAEGIVVEAFTKLWERHNKFDNLASIRSFLYTTVRNASLNWLRKKKNENQKAKELAYLNQENERTVADKLIELEFYRELFATIKSLPPHYRNICEMLYLQEKNFEQISKELKVPESTIRTQKARALLLIRKLMSRTTILIFILLKAF